MIRQLPYVDMWLIEKPTKKVSQTVSQTGAIKTLHPINISVRPMCLPGQCAFQKQRRKIFHRQIKKVLNIQDLCTETVINRWYLKQIFFESGKRQGQEESRRVKYSSNYARARTKVYMSWQNILSYYCLSFIFVIVVTVYTKSFETWIMLIFLLLVFSSRLE